MPTLSLMAHCLTAVFSHLSHRRPHPPVTMKMSMKKEPMAEDTVSVLHTLAIAWNSEVDLRGGGEGERGQGW